MTALLDTDVLVDCLRGTAAAQEWLSSVAQEAFQVPGIAGMELLVGCRNSAELGRTRQFLEQFDLVWPEAHEFARAFDILAEHRLSSGLSIPDCLIAAMALTREARLYSFNVRHFSVVAGLDAQEPYSRAA